MNKFLPLLIIILVAVLSGCTGSDTSGTLPAELQKFEKPNPNLDAIIKDVKFDREDIRAGEKVTADLIVFNTGNENITTETVEIRAKVISLDDFLANLYLKTMSDEKKTGTFTIEFDAKENPDYMILPGTKKMLSAVFNTEKERQGKSLAGKYEVAIILAVNGQKVDAKMLPVTLSSGESRVFTPTPTPTPTPTTSPTPTPTPTPEITKTPTPTPTPDLFGPAIQVTPTGKKIAVSISVSKFEVRNVNLTLGDQLVFNNFDNTIYTIVNTDNIIGNITVPKENRAFYIFNRTGVYHFDLVDKSKIMPVKLMVNVSQ